LCLRLEAPHYELSEKTGATRPKLPTYQTFYCLPTAMAIRKKGDERGNLGRAEKWERQTNVRQAVRQTWPNMHLR
jgi:hypothetical protein